MNAPRFLLWTVQRTGATNLTNALVTEFGLPVPPGEGDRSGPHEPLVKARACGEITRRWAADRDPARLAGDLAALAERGWFFKHCVDTAPMTVSVELARATAAAGYRALAVHRRDRLARLLSLHHARTTDRWFAGDAAPDAPDAPLPPLDVPALVERERESSERLARAIGRLREAGAPVSVVAFEDLYGDDGVVRLVEVLGWLGLARAYRRNASFAARIIGRGQVGDRARYAAYPGVDALAAALAALPPFDPDPASEAG